jgi:addiction module RelE/StbE family toxin
LKDGVEPAILSARWADEARLHLEDIVQYIRDRNRPAAESLEEAVHASIERLCAMPYIGRLGRVRGTREWVVHPNYLLIYRVGAETIDVLRILHSRQRYP